MVQQLAPLEPTNSPFWRDIRFLRAIGQGIFLIVVILVGFILVNNTNRGLKKAGLTFSFDYLSTPSNVQIDEGLLPHSRTDTYAHAFLVGLLNTMRVIILGLALATLLGLTMGVARLSSNWLIRTLATVYIEIMQNTPLLVQLVFLYSGVFLALPGVKQSITLPGPVYLSNRGLAMPALLGTATTGTWLIVIVVGFMVGIVVWRSRRRIQIETGRRTYALEIGLGIILLVAGMAWFILPTPPITISLPRITGFRYADAEGTIVSPEFVAIVVGLVLYTGAFIAEIVRAGIQSVPNGQWEAARAQGFNYFQILRLVIIPQALRVSIPPLTNQYLNLIKNSSLGGAVGFADVFGVGKTALDSGQAVAVMITVMLIYLVLDLTTAFLMNNLNRRAQFQVR